MKRTIFYLAICALFVYTYPALATRYHVNINKGDDADDGLLWSTAFKNLQTAIDASEEGDEIWIAAGVYHPTKKIADVYGSGNIVNTPTNDRHRSFLISKNIALYGGFPGSPSDATGMGNRDWRRNQTVLSGDFDDNDGDNFENMDENAYHVVILFEAAPSLVLDGFFITGGCADDDNTVYVDGNPIYYVTGGDGGGIYAFSYDPLKESSPTLTNLSFYGNYAHNAGGAIFNFAYANDASPGMTNLFIVHNKAKNRHGGGLYNNAGGQVHAELIDVNVVGNESTLSGGGLYFYSTEVCSPFIINTVVNGNYSNNSYGGGITMSTFSGDAEPTVVNSTICGNKSKSYGGGLIIFPVGISKANIYNTVIWGNKGNGIDNFYAEGDWGKANTIKGSFIEGYDDSDPTNLSGNTNPMFFDPVHADFAPTMDGDYQLTLGSPLINKGLNSVISLPYDLLGNTRIYGGTVDIGAYESQGTAPQFNETIADEKIIWSNGGYLYVRINSTTALHVYTLDGTMVKHVNNLGEGMYGFALPRGFYIVTLSNGITGKIVIR